MKLSTTTFFYLLAVWTVCFIGCSGGGKTTHPVTGTVKFSDGSPLTIGTIIFTSADHQATGELDSSGKFTLSSYGDGDGAPEGTYQVYFSGTVSGGDDSGDDDVGDDSGDVDPSAEEEYADDYGGDDLLDAKFADATSSGLSYTVKAESNDFSITVEKPSGQSSSSDSDADSNPDSNPD